MRVGKYQREVLQGIATSPLVDGFYTGQSYWGSWTRTWDAVAQLADKGLLEKVDFERTHGRGDHGYRLTDAGRAVLAA